MAFVENTNKRLDEKLMQYIYFSIYAEYSKNIDLGFYSIIIDYRHKNFKITQEKGTGFYEMD